jgi:hypothetical protein
MRQLPRQLRLWFRLSESCSNSTNRFLNWVRVTHAVEEEWQLRPLRNKEDRKAEILAVGREWAETDQPKIQSYYVNWLHTVTSVFGSDDAIINASRDRLTQGLTSLHTFSELQRFVKGGAKNLPTAFWNANGEDIDKVKRTLRHLIYGTGGFISRLHDVLYAPSYKLAFFGKFCALELFGTIKPEECPPMDGSIAKALRYLGFDVPGT